jgi:hypothetical protein
MRRYPQFRSTPAQVVALPSVGNATQTVRRRLGSALSGVPGNVQMLQGPPKTVGAVFYTLTAICGTYSLTGQAAAITATRAITAAQGAYTLTGQAAGLLASYSLPAAQGSYSLSGQAATLTYTPAGTYSLAAASGTYSLTGQAATLTRTIIMTADGGTYVLTGQAATLTYSGEAVAAQLSAAPIGHGPALGMRSLQLGRRMANISRRTR